MTPMTHDIDDTYQVLIHDIDDTYQVLIHDTHDTLTRFYILRTR